MILFVFSVILALVLRYWGHPILINLYIYHIGLCDSSKCLGIGGVNRITFALAVFFALHALLTRFVSSCARIDSQSWWAKGALFIVLLVCAWLLPNSFYNVYMHIARVASAFFLLLQLILLIDFAYTWNADWTSEAKGWNKGVLAACVLLYSASLTAFVLHLVYFGQGPDSCHLQKFFIGFTFALTALMTAISISPQIAEGGGLLPAGVVTAYSYWLLFSALTSDPSSCNTVSSRSKEFAPLIVGLLLTTASVAYASWSVATNTTLFEHEPLNQNAGSSGDAADEERAVSTGKEAAADDEEDEEPVDVRRTLAHAAGSERLWSSANTRIAKLNHSSNFDVAPLLFCFVASERKESRSRPSEFSFPPAHDCGEHVRVHAAERVGKRGDGRR